jgi:hypothetical protein
VTWLPEPAIELVDTAVFAAAVAEALDGGAAIVHGAGPATPVARLLTEVRGHELTQASRRVGVVEQLVYTRTLTIPTQTAPSVDRVGRRHRGLREYGLACHRSNDQPLSAPRRYLAAPGPSEVDWTRSHRDIVWNG